MLKLNIASEPGMYFKENKYPRLKGVSLVTKDPEWSHPMHAHDDVADLVLIQNGHSKVLYENKKIITEKGDLLIFNQGFLHDEHGDPNEPLESLCISLENVSIIGLEDNCVIPSYMPPIIKTGEQYELFNMLFTCILNECVEKKKGYETVCQHIVMAILSLVSRFVEQYHLVYYADSETYSLGTRMRNYFDINYNKDIDLKDLSREFNFSIYYLAHIFKQETGFSPIQYIINRRIGEAQRLLLSTDMSVHEVSRKVGYQNINHFYSLFKKFKGLPPQKFRDYYKNIK